jgi:hypothetical protein
LRNSCAHFSTACAGGGKALPTPSPLEHPAHKAVYARSLPEGNLQLVGIGSVRVVRELNLSGQDGLDIVSFIIQDVRAPQAVRPNVTKHLQFSDTSRTVLRMLCA